MNLDDQNIETAYNNVLKTINDMEIQMKKYISEQQINLIKRRPNDYIESELESIQHYAMTIIDCDKIKKSYDTYLENKLLNGPCDIKEFVNLKFNKLNDKILNSNIIVCEETYYGNKLLDIINYYKQNEYDKKYQFYMFIHMMHNHMHPLFSLYSKYFNCKQYIYKNKQLFDKIKDSIFNLPKIFLNEGKVYPSSIGQCHNPKYIFGVWSIQNISNIQFINLTELKTEIKNNTKNLLKTTIDEIMLLPNEHNPNKKFYIPRLHMYDNPNQIIPTICVESKLCDRVQHDYVHRKNIYEIYSHFYNIFEIFLKNIQEFEILFDVDESGNFSHPLIDHYKNMKSGYNYTNNQSNNNVSNTMTFDELFNSLKDTM